MGYFLDMTSVALILILPLLAAIFVEVLVIVIIYKIASSIASSNKTGKMDLNVSPEDWAEKRNEEKGIDN